MPHSKKAIRLAEQLHKLKPENEFHSRFLAIFSAAIAIADNDLMKTIATRATVAKITYQKLYEVILQSYLFLGFPRMLIAFEAIDPLFPQQNPDPEAFESAEKYSDIWIERGTRLCEKVYDNNYERLRKKVELISPEAFHWMIYEGYGKVLSRPALDIKDRELCIVAQLIIENRPVQLHSHIRGALNIGVTKSLLLDVINDFADVHNEGHQAAIKVINGIAVK